MNAEPTRIDADEVAASLNADDVITACGLQARRAGRAWRLSQCPKCGQKSETKSIAIFKSRKGGWIWKHHSGGCGGGMMDLVAACHGIDRKTDFPKLLDICASIAHVPARPLTDAEREARRAYRQQQEAQQRLDEEAVLADQRATAQREWARIANNRRHTEGEAYLRQRGLDAGELVGRGLVRFSSRGDICVPLYGFGGELITVTRRLLKPLGKLKVLVQKGGTQRGTLLFRCSDIAPGHDVVIAEGIFDALTAAYLWPERVVLGAGGVGQLVPVMLNVAKRVRRAGVRLWLIPDRDDIGQARAADAINIARRAGLAPGVDLQLLDVSPHHDLNEALAAGWRP